LQVFSAQPNICGSGRSSTN